MQHMGQKLLKGKWMSHDPSEGQGLDLLLFMQNLHAACSRIQMHDHVPTDELGRDVIAFEINADHPISGPR